MAINHRENHITHNLNLRKAIQSVINPHEYSAKVAGQMGKPLYGLFPQWVNIQSSAPLSKSPYQENAIQKAQAYLAKAK